MNARIVELAGALAEHGVKALFGVPGSGLSLQLITALEQLGVPFYGTAHEGSAAIMAGAFGLRSGSGPGCAVSIRGPGLANMLPGLLANYYEQLPLVSMAEAFGPETPRFQMHKRLDHAAATAVCTKAYATLGSPRSTVTRLVACARREIPGPVHLDLVTQGPPVFVTRDSAEEPGYAGADSWSRVRRVLDRSRRPLVIVGGVATRLGWGMRLAELRIPVLTTLAAKGVVDETLPFAAGVFTGDGKALSPEAQLLAEADLVVGLGLRNLEVLQPGPFTRPLVIADVIGRDLAEGFEPLEFLRMDKGHQVASVLDPLEAKEWGKEIVAESLDRVRRRLTDARWLPGALFAWLERGLPDVGCFVVDTGFFCTVAEHVLRARRAGAFFASANGRFMGTGLPTAIGVALAGRSAPTVCALGDGGVRMYVADVKLAVEERLPILFLLLSDGRYGSIAGTSAARGMSQRAVTIPSPSWSGAVEAMGCPAAQVKEMEEFASVVGRWDSRCGPIFVEAVFDPERYAGMIEGVR